MVDFKKLSENLERRKNLTQEQRDNEDRAKKAEIELRIKSTSPAARCTRVLQEISGVEGQSGLSDWQKGFVRSNTDNTYPNFTPKQEAKMQEIEAIVFGKKDEEEDGEDADGHFYKSPDGRIGFKGIKK